ncbi:MAG: hypothetical protein ACRDLB_15940 [Actinomycetota bacterium]
MVRRKVNRALVALVAVGMVAAAAPVTAKTVGAAAPIPCKRHAIRVLGQQRNMETVSLRDFYIEASVKKKTYRVGDTIQFPVHVSRPAEEDPFGLGMSMNPGSMGPVEEANIGVGLLIGDVFLPGFAITDANGDALIKVKIENYVKPATVDAAFYSWKIAADSPCLRVEENGFRAVPSMFKITR